MGRGCGCLTCPSLFSLLSGFGGRCCLRRRRGRISLRRSFNLMEGFLTTMDNTMCHHTRIEIKMIRINTFISNYFNFPRATTTTTTTTWGIPATTTTTTNFLQLPTPSLIPLLQQLYCPVPFKGPRSQYRTILSTGKRMG